jgi:hypothetical protein
MSTVDNGLVSESADLDAVVSDVAPSVASPTLKETEGKKALKRPIEEISKNVVDDAPSSSVVSSSATSSFDSRGLKLPVNYHDPWGPFQVQGRVNMVIQRWGNVSPISPNSFLLKLLESRGYSTDSSLAIESSYRR